MSATFKVTVRATSITVQPGEESFEYLQPLINLMEYEDEFTEEIKTLGYMLDKETDTMYLHKGVDINYLRKLLPSSTFTTDLYDEYKAMDFEYEEIIPPRNEDQVDVIDFISGLNGHANNIETSQLFLVKAPGFGKTYCSGVGLCKYGVKTLIIMHRDSLRNQWLNSLFNMVGLSSKEVHEITSSEELYQIAHNQHDFDYDVYLMTHATFRAGLRRIDNFNDACNIGKNLHIGFKIIDEAHLEFRDTLMMDAVFNVKRNLYLTATDGRSSKAENSIFKHVFANASYYKKSFLSNNLPKKWVDYYMVEVNSHCPPNIYQYKVNGFRGMNPASYGKWVIKRDKKQTHFKTCRELLRTIYTENDKAKVLIFMPLIDLCEELAYFCRMELNYDDSFGYDLNIKTINSHNTKHENQINQRADVIVTTIGSCGTGTDIPGITDIINCSPYSSKITSEQLFGRIRYCGRICHFYDVYDISIKMDVYWLKARAKKLKELALNTRYIKCSDEDDTSN